MFGLQSAQNQRTISHVGAFGWDDFVRQNDPKSTGEEPAPLRRPNQPQPLQQSTRHSPIPHVQTQAIGFSFNNQLQQEATMAPDINRPVFMKGPKKQPTKAPGPAQITMSLDRYLDLFQVLSKVQGPGAVPGGQRLSELEKGMLKITDLKQMLLLNGQSTGFSKHKQDLLDRLLSMKLIDPTYHPPAGPSSWPQTPPQLDCNSLHHLDWFRESHSTTAEAAAEAIATAGYYSVASLPEVRIVRPPPQQLPAAGAGGVHDEHQQEAAGAEEVAQPADSDVTLTSQQVLQHRCLVEEEALQGQGVLFPGTVHEKQTPAAAATAAEEANPDCVAAEIPAWLLEDIQRINDDSQGSSDYLSSLGSNPTALLRRKVAFVLLEDFSQLGTNGITDTVARGVHEGQVVEYIGPDHIEGTCETWCTAVHEFYYVRVMISSSDAPSSTWHKRRMDLVLDLRSDVRLLQVEELAGLGEEELLDAWVLLEPREEEEEGEEEERGYKSRVTCRQQKAAKRGKRRKV